MRLSASLLSVVVLCSCAHGGPGGAVKALTAAPELVESWPVETDLDHADVPDAPAVWRALIASATQTIDLAEFYVSTAAKDAVPGVEDRLEPIVVALEQAADRGVLVRLLVDESFFGKYPEIVERLANRPHVSMRRIDWKALANGGVMHAKYFVVDGHQAYLGSQNFDYRSLAHIHEIGALVSDPGVVQALAAIYERDFAAAGHEAAPASRPLPAVGAHQAFGASPGTLLPAGVAWDLEGLLRQLDGAKKSIEVQVLTYKTKERDGSPFPAIDDALRRAAERGVKVTLVVSSWGQKDAAVKALAQVANVTVKVITIPKWSGGDIPFARVAHSKYCLVDRAQAWVGTSNWEGDYFTKSRNVSLFTDEPRFVAQLGEVFDSVVNSPLTTPLSSGADPVRAH